MDSHCTSVPTRTKLERRHCFWVCQCSALLTGGASRGLGTRTKRFLYVYDFGDNWEHDVVVENIVSGNSGSEGPLCLGGKRHRPPEDYGGPPGYQNFLDAIRDPGHEEHEARLEWVGGSFDAEAFELTAVNRALIALSF